MRQVAIRLQGQEAVADGLDSDRTCLLATVFARHISMSYNHRYGRKNGQVQRIDSRVASHNCFHQTPVSCWGFLLHSGLSESSQSVVAICSLPAGISHTA